MDKKTEKRVRKYLQGIILHILEDLVPNGAARPFIHDLIMELNTCPKILELYNGEGTRTLYFNLVDSTLTSLVRRKLITSERIEAKTSYDAVVKTMGYKPKPFQSNTDQKSEHANNERS